jgi:hypothetical protein
MGGAAGTYRNIWATSAETVNNPGGAGGFNFVSRSKRLEIGAAHERHQKPPKVALYFSDGN